MNNFFMIVCCFFSMWSSPCSFFLSNIINDLFFFMIVIYYVVTQDGFITFIDRAHFIHMRRSILLPSKCRILICTWTFSINRKSKRELNWIFSIFNIFSSMECYRSIVHTTMYYVCCQINDDITSTQQLKMTKHSLGDKLINMSVWLFT